MVPDIEQQNNNKDEVTLKLYDTVENYANTGKKTPVFFSRGKWLYPLFELETYLEKTTPQKKEREKYYLEDKIIGKAAAHLVIRLGIKKLHAGILSKLGKEALDMFRVEYTFDKLVDRIICKTEKLLSAVDDPEISYHIIKKLIGGKK